MRIGRKKSRIPGREQIAKKFNYQSKIWKLVRKKVLLRDGYLCQECKRNGIIKDGNTVDHIKPINQGGEPLNTQNLQTLCETCHARKSQTERG